MLRIVAPTPPLSAVEQFALDTLVDLSRVLVCESGDVASLHVMGAAAPISLADARVRKWCLSVHDGAVHIERPLLTLVGELAGAAAEQRTDAADKYGRVPPDHNALVVARAERDPVVNRVAVALREAVVATGKRIALLAPWPEGKRWAIAMTHDLDVVDLWGAYSLMRVGELVRQGDIGRATRVAIAALGGIVQDPVKRAAADISAAEGARGIRSTWFVISGKPTLASIRAGDVTYRADKARALIVIGIAMMAPRNAVNEIGLHGSFASFTSRDEFVRQRAGFLKNQTRGVRQHFLRMRPGVSHAAMADAGFEYDSTFGFSERNGFRLGVADVIPVWHEASQRVLPIDEAPFVWMDRALSKYQHVEDPQVWIDDALVIAKACREVEGLWTGIWHPNMDDALGFPGAPAAFRSLCDSLMAESPYSATLWDIVQWRRARRSARCVGFAASGEPRVKSAVPTLALEDARGSRVNHVPA